MAAIKKKDVLRLAKLSRIALSENEVADLQHEIEAILAYVEVLQTLKLDDIAPTYQVSGQKNIMREDIEKPVLASPEDLLQNVPSKQGNYIKVNRMIA